MSQPRYRQLDTRLETGLVVGEVALLTAEAGADPSPPDWIKITPSGPAKTRDGRSFSFDPKALADRFNADGIDIPVDTDHSTVLRGGKGETPNTVGYVNQVEPRDDGTYGRVNWLDAGKSVLKAGTHRFVSPTFHHNEGGDATWLHSVALVSAPALAMPALASALAGNPTEMVSALSAIAGALGLSAGADRTAMLAAIGELRDDAVPASVHREALAALQAATGQVAHLSTAARTKEVEDLLEGALKAKKILPAQREQYLALCATDPGLATVRSLVENMPEWLAASGLDGQRVPTRDPILDSPRDLAARAAAYREDQRKAGLAITNAEAIQAVVAKHS